MIAQWRAAIIVSKVGVGGRTYDMHSLFCFFLEKSKLLAIGWQDGQVSTWNVMESLQENSSSCACSNQGVHKQPITALIWNPSGTRLVTGDKVRERET